MWSILSYEPYEKYAYKYVITLMILFRGISKMFLQNKVISYIARTCQINWKYPSNPSTWTPRITVQQQTVIIHNPCQLQSSRDKFTWEYLQNSFVSSEGPFYCDDVCTDVEWNMPNVNCAKARIGGVEVGNMSNEFGFNNKLLRWQW